jgi:hypothetical protein
MQPQDSPRWIFREPQLREPGGAKGPRCRHPPPEAHPYTYDEYDAELPSPRVRDEVLSDEDAGACIHGGASGRLLCVWRRLSAGRASLSPCWPVEELLFLEGALPFPAPPSLPSDATKCRPSTPAGEDEAQPPAKCRKMRNFASNKGAVLFRGEVPRWPGEQRARQAVLFRGGSMYFGSAHG